MIKIIENSNKVRQNNVFPSTAFSFIIASILMLILNGSCSNYSSDQKKENTVIEQYDDRGRLIIDNEFDHYSDYLKERLDLSDLQHKQIRVMLDYMKTAQQKSENVAHEDYLKDHRQKSIKSILGPEKYEEFLILKKAEKFVPIRKK